MQFFTVYMVSLQFWDFGTCRLRNWHSVLKSKNYILYWHVFGVWKQGKYNLARNVQIIIWDMDGSSRPASI